MDEHGTEVVMKETQETSGISYDKIAYIPMAVFLFIGKNLKLPFSAVFALGKFGNLLMYVIVMFGRFALQRAEITAGVCGDASDAAVSGIVLYV